MSDHTMKLLPAAPGLCSMCATDHDEHTPHNYWSLFYAMRFKMKYGRDPTHADAIAHLSAEYRTRGYPPGKVKNMPELREDFERMRNEYKRLLTNYGKKWNEPEGEPIAEPYASHESTAAK